MRRRLLSLVVLVVLAAASQALSPAGAAPPEGSGRCIVTLRPGTDPSAVAAEYRRHGADPQFVYTAALDGFAGRMSDGAVQRLRGDARVARVERDGVVSVADVQSGATWGLDRIDQRAGLSTTYEHTATGSGVTAYVLDTGVLPSHAELVGRVAAPGFSAIADGLGTGDCNGHGTHVAGTIGGTVYGVAKGVTIVPVRVLDCAGNGTWSGVLAGIDWVTADHAPAAPAVANMSLSGGAIDTVDAAVQRSIADGVTYAVAAGNNSGADACTRSPARTREALTVGSTTSTDARSSFSNVGPCVDLFAPGSSITSSWHTSDTATKTISGTSMATPHVAGAAALHLQGASSATPTAVAAHLLSTATVGKVTDARSANNLLFTGALESAPTSLTATKTVKGKVTTVTLTWSGAVASTDVLRNGARIATVSNVASYSEQVRTKGRFTYRVCSAASNACSDEVTITV